jgi:perosamine synthetase
MEDLVGGAVSVKKNERDFLAAEARFLGKLNNPEDQLLSKVLDGEGKPRGFIAPITWADVENLHLIHLLTKWRNENQFAYPSRFIATEESTQKWLEGLLLGGNRILFKLYDYSFQIIGHIGLAWNEGASRLELDSVQRGSSGSPGLMESAVRWVEDYAQKEFNSSQLHLRVLQSNTHAVKFYRRIGYEIKSSEPIIVSHHGNHEEPHEDVFLTMSINLDSNKKAKAEILTAGPSIGYRERAYTSNAVMSGWNQNHADYLRKLQDSFASFVGSKHALATSSCTGALHLAFAALGLGPGDEVIVPAVTWVATASAVAYTGASPVFADIDKKTWTLDLNSVRSKLSPRTKAIVAVHLYGFLSDVQSLRELADEFGVFLVEDAAPAIGARLSNRFAGTFGHIGCFSFQGAKLLVSGEGGMIVSDSPELFARVVKLQEHGRRPGTFWIEELGFKYKMSNLTAALALGQLERALPQIEKKRMISDWYRSSLRGLPGIEFQYELQNSESIHWMTSVLLTGDKEGRRDNLMHFLKARGIDTRPVFPNISKFDFWDVSREDLPVADSVADNGINLPSGVGLTMADVDFVSNSIRDFFDA